MRLVVDANILVGELLRVRGRILIAHAELELFVAEQTWNEARHELNKRVLAIAKQARLGEEAALNLLHLAFEVADRHLTVVNLAEYRHLEEEALRRMPQDPDDWPTVALAMALEADIWTMDGDFLGCGIATWTTDTLRLQLNLSI